MSNTSPVNLVEAARERLATEWNATTACPAGPSVPRLPDEIIGAIHRSINSKTLSYRYVLPTQLLAKVVDPSLDCRSVQAGCGLAGAFDARSLCQQVVVEFDRQNHNVLGGSTEPYANNPLRIPAITETYRPAQKDKRGFDDLRGVLDFVQANPSSAVPVLQAVLQTVRDRLARVRITYPLPNRVSLKQTLTILNDFLAERTGGVRLQTVAVALFRCIGRQFGRFADVLSAKINAADASTGSTADLECVDREGNVVLAVEVKDRRLTLRHTQDRLPGARNKGIRELLFVVQGGVEPEHELAVDQLIDREFVTGQNIYVCDFSDFLKVCLMLFGEGGRRAFLQAIGDQMDNQCVDLAHRRKWCSLLETV